MPLRKCTQALARAAHEPFCDQHPIRSFAFSETDEVHAPMSSFYFVFFIFIFIVILGFYLPFFQLSLELVFLRARVQLQTEVKAQSSSQLSSSCRHLSETATHEEVTIRTATWEERYVFMLQHLSAFNLIYFRSLRVVGPPRLGLIESRCLTWSRNLFDLVK